MFRACIVLEEFPEFEECCLDMDADSFVEVLPPDLNVEKLLSEVPEPAHVAF